MICDLKYIQKFKGEFEAEGLSRAELASEVVFAAKHGFDYLVKISGCEALSDIYYLEKLGVGSIVCPMIESPFAMRKYMSSVANKGFNSIGVTIETITAVNNVEEILDAGEHLTEVTVGRSDLSASAGIKEVEDDLDKNEIKPGESRAAMRREKRKRTRNAVKNPAQKKYNPNRPNETAFSAQSAYPIPRLNSFSAFG